ncbi:MAG: hypothetical protein DWQ58_22900 [Microcystis aeruginosa TA09]|nr:MAG: hypothetical protein DWQ58_22900 [Microcystis aeruginosa TA09]
MHKTPRPSQDQVKSPIFIILSPFSPLPPAPPMSGGLGGSHPTSPLPRYCMGKMQKEKKLQPKR